MSEYKTCAEQVQERYQSREDDFVKASEFYDKYEEATEGEKIALETFYEDVSGYEDFFDFIFSYGLSFDYVERGTFEDQERGYFRYQLSWGGGQDEFRIYVDYDKQITHIDYWYLDWGDGASIRVDENSLSYQVCEQFLEFQTEVA
tara:strand:+ start:124 stop:561 length:438 start_codon:yes stop_codon:yes gene_type:complete